MKQVQFDECPASAACEDCEAKLPFYRRWGRTLGRLFGLI